MKKITFYFILSVFNYSSTEATFIFDTSLHDAQYNENVLDCISENSFPKIIHNINIEKEIKEHFITFSDTTFLDTPESRFVSKKLNEKNIPTNIIHLPNTLYDLYAIYDVLINEDFYLKSKKNLLEGCNYYMGIENTKIPDEQFFRVSQSIFPIYAKLNTKNEIIEEANNIIDKIINIKQPSDLRMHNETNKYLSVEKYKKLIIDIIKFELKSNKKGMVNFYRGTRGTIDINGFNEDKKNCNYLNDFDHSLHETKLSIINSLETLGMLRTNELNANDNLVTFFNKINVEEIFSLNGFKFDDLKSRITQLLKNWNLVDSPFIDDAKSYTLSFNCNLLGGWFFDGLFDTISSCPFIFATKDSNKYPFLYALSYKLNEFYKDYSIIFDIFFNNNIAPLHATVLNAGERYHPRLTLRWNNTKPDFKWLLESFHAHIHIIGISGESAKSDTNKVFLDKLIERHKKYY